MSVSKKNWSAAITIMDNVAVTTGSDSNNVDLETEGYEGAHVTVYADFPGSPTDKLVVEVRGSLDGASPDKTPMYKQTLDNDPDPNSISLIIKDVAHFDLRCYRDGTTDTITVTIKYKAWNWATT